MAGDADKATRENKAMAFRRYSVTLTGQSPLLMHHDNLAWAEMMKKWGKDPANRAESVAGDDRSPAWRWIGCLYHDKGLIALPSDNLMTVLREGGAKCPTGKGSKTYKAQTQSGLIVDQSAWPLIVRGKEIPLEPFMGLIDNPDFEAHEQMASAHGFELFAKRAKIGQAKHVRVRPRFDDWAASGSISVSDDAITAEVLLDILRFAGTYSGIGDWRPSSSKSPGSFGKFIVTVKGM